MKNRLTHIVLFAIVALTPAAFLQVNAQTAPARRHNPQAAVGALRFAAGSSALKIPLEIDNNLILLRVSVNNSKPLRFIFDTGASHTIIDAKRASELGLKTQGVARGTASGGPIQGAYIKGVSVSVQGAAVSNQVIGSIPLPVIPGFEFDGVIGYGFIKEFVVEIDYLSKTMNLYDRRHFAYSGKGEVIPLSIAGGVPFALTKIILHGRVASIEAKLEIDTGSDGTFVINTPFVEKHKLLKVIPETTAHRGRGAGGEQDRRVGRIKALQLGRFVINDPPVALALDTAGSRTSKDHDGVIGGEVFRRFKLILDYSRKRMILEPNASFGEPYGEPSGL